MGINFFEWLVGKKGVNGSPFRDVDCSALFEAGCEYTLRRYAFDTCVDMIAQAFGRVDFHDYAGGAEIRDRESWTWNVEPGPNINSTAFLHRFVDQLYRTNNALIVGVPVRGQGYDALAVADSWEQTEEQVTGLMKYWDVTVGGLHLKRVYREDEVLKLKLNNRANEPVLRALGDSWNRMANIAQAHFEWDRGQHWKVHIDQMASGADNFDANFAAMLKNQIKPFLENPSAVLPEFDGYSFTQIGAGSEKIDSEKETKALRSLAEDIFNFTARGFLLPIVLVNGTVEQTADANARFMTYVIDPLADQLQEEINRKRYGFDKWSRGEYMRVDTSSILHYDLFAQANSIEKLISSGYSPNEIRRAAGQTEIKEPWAETHFLTKNIGTMQDAVTAANNAQTGQEGD